MLEDCFINLKTIIFLSFLTLQTTSSLSFSSFLFMAPTHLHTPTIFIQLSSILRTLKGVTSISKKLGSKED
ncbi:hypothetical protein HanRHA438_Chr02g0067721 [Helianthus annuus]|nr:hypothetical protein HanRHA438_Chr02g0067721 [Helianthus annuus]